MSTTSLQNRPSAGAIVVEDVFRKYNRKRYLPKLPNARVCFDSNGNLIASTAPENFIVKSENYTAVTGDRIATDTTEAAFTVTLPASPVAGNRVQLMDAGATWDTNNLTVGRNGNKINSATSNLTLSSENGLVELVYIDATIGWKAIYAAQAVGSQTITGTLDVSGNVAVNTNKFTVAASSGNTVVAGTLGVTGNVAVNTDKFTITASSGNTAVAGTFAVTGLSTFTGGVVGGLQALSGAGAVDVTTLTTRLTTSGAAQALTLANGTAGQIKIIIHEVDGGSAVLTPTTKTCFSTITFTSVGESATLQYLATRGWCILSLNGAVAA